MTKLTIKKYAKVIFPAILFFVLTLIMPQTNFAQSSDPDAPTALTKGVIEGSSSGGSSDEKTYYYTFDVVKGTLTLTLDITPLNKSDAGGYVEWSMMDTKFATLKYDNLSAQGSPERQVKDLPVTIKRRIIMKIVVSGNINYKFKLAGSAVNFAR